jgi:hypothetical protein
MVYQVIADNRRDHPQFIVVRHEDLSTDPLKGYQELYDQLGLSFTPRAQKIIQRSSGAKNPKELSSSSRHSVRLDSQANLENWRHRLTANEIHCIRQATEEVAWLYYPDPGWK